MQTDKLECNPVHIHLFCINIDNGCIKIMTMGGCSQITNAHKRIYITWENASLKNNILKIMNMENNRTNDYTWKSSRQRIKSDQEQKEKIST